MRALFMFILTCLASPVWADAYMQLYRAAGWPQHRQHFTVVLGSAQQHYRDILPTGLYQTLLNNSNRRFNSTVIDQRALNSLRTHLPDPKSALTFFQSPLGQKISAAETAATHRNHLSQHANGIPSTQASPERRRQIKALTLAIPFQEATTEVSLALANMAIDSLGQILPSVPLGPSGQRLLAGQRPRLKAHFGGNIENTLLYVYRELSDRELSRFVRFAQSDNGQDYYQAALQAVRDGLANGARPEQLSQSAFRF